MKKLMKILNASVLGLSAFLCQRQALAGEVFTIKAAGRPQYMEFAINEGGSYWNTGIEVITDSAINCGGTQTTRLRIVTAPRANTNAPDPNPQHDAGFIASAEIIGAAKAGYVIETNGTIQYAGGSANACTVVNYFIRYH